MNWNQRGALQFINPASDTRLQRVLKKMQSPCFKYVITDYVED